MSTKIINETKFPEGYLVRTEQEGDREYEFAYNLEGVFIPIDALRLVVERGIKPERLPGCDVCLMGFCEREQKWYGWSHRAICGFGVGDKFFVGFEYDPAIHDWPVKIETTKIIETLEEARQAAINFAEGVS